MAVDEITPGESRTYIDINVPSSAVGVSSCDVADDIPATGSTDENGGDHVATDTFEQCNSTVGCGKLKIGGYTFYEDAGESCPLTGQGNECEMEGEVYRGASVINGQGLNYLHQAADIPHVAPSLLSLRRLHQSRAIDRDSSFGPGVFSNFDYRLELYDIMQSQHVELFLPARLRSVDFTRNFGMASPPYDNHWTPDRSNEFEEVLLLDSSENVIDITSGVSPTGTEWYDAVYAQVKLWSGDTLLFELMEDIQNPADPSASEPNYLGRVVRMTSRVGNEVTLTYKSWTAAQITASPSRRWQIDTITGPYGRTLTFTYKSAMVGGTWVVDDVTAPGSQTTSYTYTGDFLTSVSHPDGSQSTFTYGFDTTSDCGTVEFDDPTAVLGGSHRRKTVYFQGMQ